MFEDIEIHILLLTKNQQRRNLQKYEYKYAYESKRFNVATPKRSSKSIKKI
jgi:hypothetical protein